MQHKRWTLGVLTAIGVAASMLLNPVRVAADPPWCAYPVQKFCRGAALSGSHTTGYVPCDAGNSCRCPLPAHDYSLIFNECAGQAP